MAFNGSSPALHFDPAVGLSDGTDLIPAGDIISLLPSAAGTSYTLQHTLAADSPPRLHQTVLTAPPAALLARYTLAALPPHLDPTLVDISVVVSAGSGTGTALPFWLDVAQPLLALHGLPATAYTVHTTTSAASIHTLAAGLSRTRAQSLLLLSGDTLLFELLNSLPALPVRPIISLLPLGTGNALSASLTRSSPPLSTLLLGTARPLPSFTARFSPGAQFLHGGVSYTPLPASGILRAAVVLSWGFHASLVADSDTAALRLLGASRFGVAAQQNLQPSPHAYHGAVSLRQQHAWTSVGAPTAHFYNLITPLSHLERAFCVSPDARALVPQLRYVGFGARPPADIMRLMAAAYDGGSHVRDPAVRYEPVDGVKIEVSEEEERWRRVCVDGAIVVVRQGGDVLVELDREGVVDVVYRE